LRNFHKWKNYQEIIAHNKVLVYPREFQKGESNNEPVLPENLSIYSHAIQFTSAPVIGISSSMIRDMIKNDKDVSFLLTKEAQEYIDKMNFYR
jgi:nicotinate-nucleotide adenylyltransferase